MINNKSSLAIFMAIILTLFVTTSTALAISSSSPTQGATSNNGLKVEGDASGTKLKGIIAVSVSEPYCDMDHTIAGGATAAEYWGECEADVDTDGDGVVDIFGDGLVNAAFSTVVVRLSDGNAKSEAGVYAFYVDLGSIPFPKDQDVQTIVTGTLRPYILRAFFEVPFGVYSPLKIHLKEASQYKEANIHSKDYDGGPFNEEKTDEPSMTVANIILAVN